MKCMYVRQYRLLIEYYDAKSKLHPGMKGAGGGEGELITAGKGKQGRNIAANNIPLYALLWEKDHAM